MGAPYSYRGETLRSAYQRGIEHMDDVDRGIIKNPLVQHYWEIHDGVKQEFIMRITSKHQSPLERQAQEAIQIAKFS